MAPVGDAPSQPPVVYETHVPISGVDEVQELIDGGFNVGHVDEDRAEVYVRAEGIERLAAEGFNPVVVAVQPNPPEFNKSRKGLGVYNNYASVTAFVEAYAADNPDIARLFTLGQSVQGRELWALLITDNPDIEEDEPEFKYVSTMHGDEPVGTELCLYLIDRLLTDYGTDGRITALVDQTAIWIVPLMNPDGLELGSRTNASGIDLNRSFPDRLEIMANVFDGGPLDAAGRPPETRAVMEWTVANSFVLSANLHTGARLVNYPYDDDGFPSGVDSPTPDDLLFEDISLRYATPNPMMGDSVLFPGGITNGAAWFVIMGGMQDWNYRYASCNEVTLELATPKRPPEESLPAFWDANEESMLAYMEAAHIGIRGLVTDDETGAPLFAKVGVAEIDHPVFTDPDVGDYHRMLLAGTYTLEVAAEGYVTRKFRDVTVVDGPATRVDVTLMSGDVNDDGDVNSLDLQQVLNSVLKSAPCANCDFDGGGVTVTDVQLMVNTLLRVF